MRIAFIITRSDTIGGAQIHVRDLARRLGEDGHEPLVITGEAGPYTEALTASGIRSLVCPELRREIRPAQDARALAALRGGIRAFKPDLISTHSSKAGWLGRLAAKATGTPSLFTAHGWAFTHGVPEPRQTVYRVLERAAAPLAVKIVCVSEHDRLIATAAGMAPERLMTIHNGMPDVPASLRATPDAGDPVRIVMVARMDRQKDHATLIRAIRGIDGVHLDLIGEGPGEASVRALAREVGVANRVHFLGQRHDVAEVLAKAHLFALISHWEGFPRSTLEAMRAGLPVVVSDVGGAAEAVEEGVTGYVVPRGDVAAVRERLATLVDRAARRREMGALGRRRFEAAFTFDHMFERTVALYGDILTGRTATS